MVPRVPWNPPFWLVYIPRHIRLCVAIRFRGPRAAILKTSLIENRRGQRAKWAWHHFPPCLIVSTVQCVENNSILHPRVHQNASQSIYISKNFSGRHAPRPPYIEPLTRQNWASPNIGTPLFKFLNPPLIMTS